jgi:hypothetical protein
VGKFGLVSCCIGTAWKHFCFALKSMHDDVEKNIQGYLDGIQDQNVFENLMI